VRKCAGLIQKSYRFKRRRIRFAFSHIKNLQLHPSKVEAYIKAIEVYLPQQTLENQELAERFPDWSAKKVFEKVGITRRHIAAFDETAGDMAAKSCSLLFESGEIAKSDIGFLILCTQSPDYFLPTTACILQDRLGLSTKCGAFDINLGCSGYIYGLAVSKGLIGAGCASNILLVTSETYSKYIADDDKSNLSIFGDAACATLISTNGLYKVANFAFGTDGSGASKLIVKKGASREPVLPRIHSALIPGSETNPMSKPPFLEMDGPAVFNFTLASVPKLIEQTLIANAVTFDSVDMFIFHQANSLMLSTLKKVCKIPDDKFFVSMEDVGNTVSSTIPICLSRFQKMHGISGKTILLCGFGVGFSWGGCILQ